MIELDHLAFGAADVASTRADLERLGFRTTPISRCSWVRAGAPTSAASVSVVFDSQYLDFVEIRDPSWAEHLASSVVYSRGVAPSGIVLRGLAPREARSIWRSRGAELDESYRIVRTLPGADPPEIEYELLSLRGSRLPLGLIRDTAPRAMRTREWTMHPNGATGIEGLHLRVPSVDESRHALERFAEVDLESARIWLHEAPADPYLRGVSELLPGPARAALLAAEIGTSDLDRARRSLVAAGVSRVDPDATGGLAIEPSEGPGIGLRFVARGPSTER